MVQPVLLDILFVQARAPESVAARRVEVRLDRLVRLLLPPVGVEHTARQDRPQDRPGIVVAVIDPLVRIGPAQQSESRALRIVAGAVPELLERIIRKPRGDFLQVFVLQQVTRQGERHGGLSLYIVAEPITVCLTAVLVDGRAMAFQHAEAAVAVRRIFRKRRADGHQPVPLIAEQPGLLPGGMDEEVPVEEPFDPLPDGLLPRFAGQRGIGAIGRMHQ